MASTAAVFVKVSVPENSTGIPDTKTTSLYSYPLLVAELVGFDPDEIPPSYPLSPAIPQTHVWSIVNIDISKKNNLFFIKQTPF
jgi:hypothetical protein